MRPILIIFLWSCFILNSSCEDDNNIIAPEVSIYIDGKLYRSNSALNVYSLDRSLTNSNLLIIHIRINPYSDDEIDINLRCVTSTITGTFNSSNTVENDYANTLSFRDKTDGFYAKSSKKCNTADFSFTIERQIEDPALLSGTFFGTACDDEGNNVTVTEGKFSNFRLFPPAHN